VQVHEDGKGGLRDILAIARRRFRVALLTFAVLFAPSLAFVLFLPDLYRATATVLVERQPVPETFVQPSVTEAVDTRLHTIGQEVLSRRHLVELIERFDLYPTLRRRVGAEDLTGRMRRDIGVARKEVAQDWGRSATIAFDLSYRGTDPRKAAEVTNALAAFYVDENVRLRERQAARTVEFLQAQLQDMRKKLDEQEARAGAYTARHAGELPQQMEANLATLERLNTQLQLNSENQIRALERREQLERRRAGLAPAGAAAGPEDDAARLARLRRELVDLRSRYTSRYPDVVRLERDIAALERRVGDSAGAAAPGGEAAAGDGAPPGARAADAGAAAGFEAEIRALKAEETRLRRAIQAYEERVENAPRRQQEFDELSRDHRTTRDLYHSLLKKYEEALLARSLEHGQTAERFRILDPALPPATPEGPARPWLGVLLFVAAAGAAVGIAALAEHADTSFHGVDALREFARVPVLASIPRIVTRADSRRRAVLAAAALVAAAGGVAALVGLAYHAAHQYEQIVYLLSRVGS
jgi:polysaccharide chain length determinant protein (PEP-CTERM system associated)